MTSGKDIGIYPQSDASAMLYQYLELRTKIEGTIFELEWDQFQTDFGNRPKSVFGVQLEYTPAGHVRILNDEQEPQEGYFELTMFEIIQETRRNDD